MALALSSLLPAPLPVENVQLTLPEITTATETFDVTITNQSCAEIGYGLDAFTIEKQTALGWIALEKSGDYAVIDLLCVLHPGETGTLKVNLPLLYKKTLDAGAYRFRFRYFSNDQKETASVTFTVVSAV